MSCSCTGPRRRLPTSCAAPSSPRSAPPSRSSPKAPGTAASSTAVFGSSRSDSKSGRGGIRPRCRSHGTSTSASLLTSPMTLRKNCGSLTACTAQARTAAPEASPRSPTAGRCDRCADPLDGADGNVAIGVRHPCGNDRRSSGQQCDRSTDDSGALLHGPRRWLRPDSGRRRRRCLARWAGAGRYGPCGARWRGGAARRGCESARFQFCDLAAEAFAAAERRLTEAH